MAQTYILHTKKTHTHRIQQRQQQQQVNVSVKESERRRWMYISKVRLRRLLQIEWRKKAANTHTHLPITTAKRNEWEKKGKWYTRTIKTKPSHNIESIELKNRETQNKHEIFDHGYCYPTTLLLASHCNRSGSGSSSSRHWINPAFIYT